MLPYDNMDFVPFDVLTAEELDQMVANIESLADGSGIEDGAVTADKVDLATLHLGDNTKTSTSTLLTTSYATFATVTATSNGGKVRLDWSALIRNAGSSSGNNADIKVVRNGSTDITPILNVFSADLGTPNEGNTNSFILFDTPSSGSYTWTLQAKANANTSVYIDQAVLVATQVGN